MNGKEWTFSSTLSVDTSWNATGDSGDLVDITRENARTQKGPANGQSYQTPGDLSVHCDLSPLASGSVSDVTKVAVRRILQISKPTCNSLWEPWLPDYAWRPVRGGLCGDKEFEKALTEKKHGTDHPRADSLQCKMMVQGEFGLNNMGSRAAPARLVVGVLSRANQIHRRLDRLAIAPGLESKTKASAHVPHPTRQAAFAGGAPRSDGVVKRKSCGSKSSSRSGQASIHLQRKMNQLKKQGYEFLY